MVVTRWEPLKDLITIQERMNKLFAETFSRGRQDQEAGVWSPAVDIMEKGDKIILTMELPGVDQKAIDINVEGDVLTIKGERQLEEGIKQEDYHRLERYLFSFPPLFFASSFIGG